MEPAAAAGHIHDADLVKPPQERLGRREVMPVLPEQGDDLVHQRGEQRLDQAVGHRRGNGRRGVVDALVLAVGREEHLVGLAEDVLVDAAVVVVDDAAVEGLVPLRDAQQQIQLAAEAVQVGGGLVELLPDPLLKQLGVVVLVEPFLDALQEGADVGRRAFGLPVSLLAVIAVLEEAERDQAVVFQRLGEDELVDEQDDQFAGALGLEKADGRELPDPLVKVLEEGAVELGLLDFILGAAEDIVEVAALGVAFQQLGKRQLAEEGVLDEGVPRAVEIGIPQVGQDDILVFAEVFLDLFQVRPGVQLVAAEFLGVVAREQAA